MPRLLRVALLAALFFSSCAGPRLDVDDVLTDTLPAAAQAQFPTQAQFDMRASEARGHALDDPKSAELQLQASRALFLAANVRVQAATLAYLDTLEAASLEQVLTAEDNLSSELHAEVESLTADGLDFAKRAAALDPHDRGALLYRAIHTSLLAWSVGNSRALFEGLGAQCKSAISACLAEPPLEVSAAYEGAAPLRLRGRFYTKAPWPMRDIELSLELLHRATELAPVTLNYLFLGDALHASGDLPAAREAWQLAADSPSDPGSAALGEYHREFARRRLVAVD